VPVGSGAARAIPGSDPKDSIEVSPPFGTDVVAVLAFEQRPEFFDQLNGSEPFGADSARAESLSGALRHVRGSVGVQRIDVHTYAGKPGTRCGL
jgi:hypothetical protein